MVVLTVKWQRKKKDAFPYLDRDVLASQHCVRAKRTPPGSLRGVSLLLSRVCLGKASYSMPQTSEKKGATISHLIISPRFSRRALTTACKETHHPFFGVLLSLCLSRACLGKNYDGAFSYKMACFLMLTLVTRSPSRARIFVSCLPSASDGETSVPSTAQPACWSSELPGWSPAHDVRRRIITTRYNYQIM